MLGEAVWRPPGMLSLLHSPAQGLHILMSAQIARGVLPAMMSLEMERRNVFMIFLQRPVSSLILLHTRDAAWAMLSCRGSAMRGHRDMVSPAQLCHPAGSSSLNPGHL